MKKITYKQFVDSIINTYVIVCVSIIISRNFRTDFICEGILLLIGGGIFGAWLDLIEE